MKIVINYKNKIYIRKKQPMALVFEKINSLMDVLDLPIHISIYKDNVKDFDILGSYKYLKEKRKKLNLAKPKIIYDEFIIPEEKED